MSGDLPWSRTRLNTSLPDYPDSTVAARLSPRRLQEICDLIHRVPNVSNLLIEIGNCLLLLLQKHARIIVIRNPNRGLAGATLDRKHFVRGVGWGNFLHPEGRALALAALSGPKHTNLQLRGISSHNLTDSSLTHAAQLSTIPTLGVGSA